MKKIFLILFAFAFTNVIFAQDAKTVIDKMISAVSAGKSYEYTMKQTERINGKNHYNTIFAKVNESPKKVFLDNLEGSNKGVQVLYVKGERDNKALINKMFGVKLSPYNSLIRKNQHHTILETGFGMLLNLMKDAKKRADAQGAFNEVFKLEGSVTFNGRACYKVILSDPTFTYVNYTIQSSESLHSIALKKKVNEQLIMEKNNLGFGGAKTGATIQIPSSYAKKTILYIDKANYHPIFQEMYDDKGVYERYEFSGLKVNPSFTALDFSEDNDAYDF